MEQDYANGLAPSPYEPDRQQRRVWDSNQVPFSTSYVSESTTQLPPIQTQRGGYEQVASSNTYDPTRRPQPLPNTSLAQPYSPYSAQTPQSPYGHAIPQFHHNAHLFSQTGQQISPVTQHFPASTYSPIRPMPPALASGQVHPLSAGFAPPSNYGFPPSADDHPDSPHRLHHVVGSQGRRGVLPSDEGRPQAIAATVPGPKSSIIPQKDADGKFPCPHCNKTYLHGKHLKRHLLRHTGDRPYSCFLCADTFSRSDILKRHFQKCSQRRGNPTGASHLAFSQTHLKRQAARAKATAAQATNVQRDTQNNGTMIDVNGSAGTQPNMNGSTGIYDSNVGMGALHANQHHLADISAKPYADMRDTRSGPAASSPGLNRSQQQQQHQQHQGYMSQAGSTSLPSSGSSTPLTAKTPGGHFPQQTFLNESQRAMYSDMSPRNDHHANNHLVAGSAPYDGANAFEWSPFSAHGKDSSGSVPSVFASAGQPSPTSYQNSNPDSQQGHFKTTIPRLKDSHEADPSALAVLPVSQAKSERLIAFCQLDRSIHHEELRNALAPHKIDHFIQQYYHHFYQHFPIIHIPTFYPETTHDGLLLAIICTGAVYSEHLEIQQVRELARKTAISLKNSSSWFNSPSPIADVSDIVRMDELADELHAFISISSLSLWHGDDLQKLQAMKDWHSCISLTLQLGLNEVASGLHPKFSFFHQPGFVEDGHRHQFSYSAWLWQEKRNRLMFTIFLTDAVLAFFFNQTPKLDPLQLRIPLPCDDAAWDAPDEESCVTALGFYGPNHQQVSNVSGSLRRKQPEMHLALASLETLGKDLAPRTTNAASKFLLIHGLLVHLCTVQRSSTLAPRDFPIRESDWIVELMHDPAKPIDPSPLSIVEAAADKWIKAWDRDMVSQYPPGVERVGYSRDGVHYYWLAKLLTQNSDTVNVHSPWNERLQQILKILKYIKTWVSGNQRVRGEGTGSVSLLDERYGLEDLSKDMKLLLAPLGF